MLDGFRRRRVGRLCHGYDCGGLGRTGHGRSNSRFGSGAESGAARPSIVQGVAVGLILSSWLVIVYAIAGSLLWNYAIRPLEESDLETRFGDD